MSRDIAVLSCLGLEHAARPTHQLPDVKYLSGSEQQNELNEASLEISKW